MLDSLKRLFSRDAGASAAADHDWPELADWATARQATFKPVKGAKEVEGFVIDGRVGAQPWRLEWGPAQRPYIAGHELRLRAETGAPGDLQAMLLDRPLQAAIEKTMFEQYVESVQTRIDNETPAEMRWLVMFPKASGNELGALRERFAGVASSKGWTARWLDGPLTAALADAPLLAGQPVVLALSRGRLTLRTALPEPTLSAVRAWTHLFETAVRETRRAATQRGDAPSTQPSLWAPSDVPPGDTGAR